MTRKEKRWLDALRTEFGAPIQAIAKEPIQKAIEKQKPKPIPEPVRRVVETKVNVQKPVRKKRRIARPLDDRATVEFCTMVVSDRFRYYMSVYRRASRGNKKTIDEALRLRDEILEDEFMHAYANYINSDLSELLEYLERKL